MKRMLISLTERQIAFLEEEKRATGLPFASIVRNSLEQHFRQSNDDFNDDKVKPVLNGERLG